MDNVLCYWIHDATNESADIHCSDGRKIEAHDWMELADFVVKPCKFALVLNLEVFTKLFIKLLPPNAGKELQQEKGRAVLQDAAYEYRIFHIVDRQLSVTAKNRVHLQGNIHGPFEVVEVDIYGVSQLMDKVPSDCESFTKECHLILEAMKTVLGEYPSKLTSVVGAADELLDRLDFVRYLDMPEELLDIADYCDPLMQVSEWRELFQMGHWKEGECFDYDISGCYPSIMSTLTDLRNADIWKEPEYNRNCDWAIFYGTLNITAPINPFAHINGNNMICYPVGKRQGIITLDQLRLMGRWKMGTFRNEGTVWHIKYHSSHKPYQATSINMFRLRGSHQPYVGKVAKSLSNGLYGKLAQVYANGKVGPHYQPIYACEVVTRGAIMVADFIYRHRIQDNLISVTVDGVLTDNEVDGVGTDKILGEWRFNEPAAFLISNFDAQMSSNGKKATDGTTYQEAMEYIQTNHDKPHIELRPHNRVFNDSPQTKGDYLKYKYRSTPMEVNNDH